MEAKINTAGKVIAAVRTHEELLKAAASNVKNVFYLSADILTLKEDIDLLHNMKKKLFIHFDLAKGIANDRSGIEYIKKLGVDGIISTRTGTIKIAREMGVFTVQRFFIVDSQSIFQAIEAVKTSKAQIIEIMPGTMIKAIKRLKDVVDVPIIAGGLIETKDEIEEIITNGAAAVSTGKAQLWGGKDV